MGTTIESFFRVKGTNIVMQGEITPLAPGEEKEIEDVYTGGAPGERLEVIIVKNINNVRTLITSPSGTEILEGNSDVDFPAKSEIEFGEAGYCIRNTISQLQA